MTALRAFRFSQPKSSSHKIAEELRDFGVPEEFNRVAEALAEAEPAERSGAGPE
jgi:hypothetical protein